MDTLMEDPVILPASKAVLDRSTINRCPASLCVGLRLQHSPQCLCCLSQVISALLCFCSVCEEMRSCMHHLTEASGVQDTAFRCHGPSH